jgi:hypothetical protein
MAWISGRSEIILDHLFFSFFTTSTFLGKIVVDENLVYNLFYSYKSYATSMFPIITMKIGTNNHKKYNVKSKNNHLTLN